MIRKFLKQFCTCVGHLTLCARFDLDLPTQMFELDVIWCELFVTTGLFYAIRFFWKNNYLLGKESTCCKVWVLQNNLSFKTTSGTPENGLFNKMVAINSDYIEHYAVYIESVLLLGCPFSDSFSAKKCQQQPKPKKC